MIYTGTYRDGEKLGNGAFYKLRISVTQPKWANTDGAVPALFPDADLLWGFKQGSVTMEQYTQRYLAALDARRDQVKAQVENARRLAGGRPLILLCWCGKGKFCHRRLFARWWRENTGEDVQEI